MALKFVFNAITGNFDLVDVTDTSGFVTAVTASAPLSSSGGTTPNLTITQAGAASNGFLSSIDWNTFNNKQSAGNYITALTGDISASGPGSATATLATVNSTVGSFGSASNVGTFTVNAKGLITAASDTAIQIAESQVTNLVSDLAGKQAVGNYITALTGDGTASGPGSVAFTLATVNADIGTFNNLTVNAKGLVTAGSNVAYLTGNQTITLSGDVTGSGATAITTNVGAINGVAYNADPLTQYALLAGRSGGQTLVGGSGGLILQAGGSDQNITLTPSGTGIVQAADGVRFGTDKNTGSLSIGNAVSNVSTLVLDRTYDTASAVQAIQGEILNNGNGNVTGLNYIANSAASGTVSFIRGMKARSRFTGTGTATEASGLVIDSGLNTGGGTITTQYGLRIIAQTVGSTNYQIYSEGTAQSYFAGNVGIGATNPVSLLDVNATTGGIMTLRRFDTSVAANDMIGKIQFYAADSATSSNFIVADIEAQATNTVSTDINPGRLIFRTTDATVAATPTERMRISETGSVIVGTAALATTATDGFLYIPTCAGVPTGVPTAQTGRVAMVFDTTNNKFMIYDGGWIGVAMA